MFDQPIQLKSELHPSMPNPFLTAQRIVPATTFNSRKILPSSHNSSKIIKHIQEGEGKVPLYSQQFKQNYECIIFLKMNKNFPFEHQQLPTLQSIDAQSQFSVDLPQNEKESLLLKLFMIALQNQRKEMIVRELQVEAERGELRHSQFDNQNRQIMHRFEKLEFENRNLLEANGILKSNLLTLEKTNSQLELFRSRGTYNQEVEEKNYILQSKLKRAEEEKIELRQKEQELQRQLSMLSYDVLKTEKNKIRELEHELIQERSKYENERKNSKQQQYRIDKYEQQIRCFKEQEMNLIRNYEEKLQLVKANTNLKQSQVSVSEERIVLLSQQLNRLKEEVDYLQRQIYEEREKVSERDEEIKKLTYDVKGYEHQLENFQRNYHQVIEENKQCQSELYNTKEQTAQFEKKCNDMKVAYAEIEYLLKQKASFHNDQLNENQHLLEELHSRQSQLTSLKSEMKKLKRKNITTQCQVCKLKASTASVRKIEPNRLADIDEIIRQTEKLSQSNRKIENLISHHELNSQHSIQIRTLSRQ